MPVISIGINPNRYVLSYALLDRIEKGDSMGTLVSVVMSSRSDWQTMKYVAETLASMPVSHEVRIVSAHRTADQLLKFAKSAEERGVNIIIASAKGAVHLPHLLASRTHIPVLGVPLESKTVKGKDSLLSMIETPAGVPVGTFASGRVGAINAALLATSMLANDNEAIRKALVDYRTQQITPDQHPIAV